MATDWQIAPGFVPKGSMVFAVGDVHGYVDLLKELRQLIQVEIDSRPDLRCKIIYLGDYIDRGPHSKEVLEFVTEEWLQGKVETVFLSGNHEYFLKSLLNLDDDDDQRDLIETTAVWLQNGGDSAIRSFHLGLQKGDFEDLRRLRDRLVHALGLDVLAFLRQLRLWHRIGDYLFVHAGIDPQIPFTDCNLEDLLWMRHPFLNANGGWRHPFSVVHGHTPSCPEIHPHRIGVDTGVYLCEALSAVQLFDCKARFLTVAMDQSGIWQEELRRGQPQPYRLLESNDWMI
jgi:serine/threonine protein phosphatase 1